MDLHRSESVGSVVLYESQTAASFNRRPLHVEFSPDGKTWTPVAQITEEKEPDKSARLCLVLPQPLTARYVQVRASGTCCLSLDEVEVYRQTPLTDGRGSDRSARGPPSEPRP